MNILQTTRAEWDAMTDDEKFQSLRLTEKDNAEMRSVLEEIPECPDHGFCLPYKRAWIRTIISGVKKDNDHFLVLDRQLRAAFGLLS